jgi:transposase-like protein
VDHLTVHRWIIVLVPLFEKAFRSQKRPVGRSWRKDDACIKGGGQWKSCMRCRQGRQHRRLSAARAS